jgi:hypothetical protein
MRARRYFLMSLFVMVVMASDATILPPKWELVETTAAPVIEKTHPDVVANRIFAGFETGQYQRINTSITRRTKQCPGVDWDLVTRAALWRAPNS